MQKVKINQTYSLDMGDLAEIKIRVRALEFLEDGILCEYLGSWTGRKGVVSYGIFEMNGFCCCPATV